MNPPRAPVWSSRSSITTALVTRLGCELAHRPFTMAASLLTMGLLLYSLAPFDFVTTTDALHASFGRAHWGLWNTRAAGVGSPPFAAIAYQLTGAGWFAALGYLLALGGRERSLNSTISLGSALRDGLILVVLVEFMQLFTQSHSFDTAGILIRSLGVFLGTWCAVFLIDSLAWSAWHRDGLQVAQPLTGGCADGLAVPTIYMSHNHSRVVVLMAILIVFQIGLLIAPCMYPVARSFSSDRPMAELWLPIETLRRQSFPTAATEVLSALLTFGTLALTLRILLRRFRTARPGWWTFGAVTLVATTCESLFLWIAGTPMDVTTLLLAWLSVTLVLSSWKASTSEAHVPITVRGTRLPS